MIPCWICFVPTVGFSGVSVGEKAGMPRYSRPGCTLELWEDTLVLTVWDDFIISTRNSQKMLW